MPDPRLQRMHSSSKQVLSPRILEADDEHLLNNHQSAIQTFLTYSDFSLIAPIPSTLQSIS